MFHYPQTTGVDLYSTPKAARDAGSYFQESRLFLYLGHVNQAERCAYEALETTGNLPAVLRQLALINIVKDRPETARVFLNALDKKLFHRRTATEMLRRLDEDPRLENDPHVREIRRAAVGKDSVSLDTSVESFLQALLETNPGNKMAFEFLMAHYLCIARPDKVAASVQDLKNLGYPAIPRHYQEAILVHSSLTGSPPRATGYPMDSEIIERARQFMEIQAGAASAEGAAQRALAAGFGNTYFFYFAYGASGL
jgi:hypothetical protein